MFIQNLFAAAASVFNMAFIFGSGCKIIGAISLSFVHANVYLVCGKLQCTFHVNQRFELLFYACLNGSCLCSIICQVKYLQLNDFWVQFVLPKRSVYIIL